VAPGADLAKNATKISEMSQKCFTQKERQKQKPFTKKTSQLSLGFANAAGAKTSKRLIEMIFQPQ
jgi:hypothetical protein